LEFSFILVRNDLSRVLCVITFVDSSWFVAVEVDLSEGGKEMLKNFVINVAKVEPNYTIDDREHLAITEIQHKVLNQVFN
jgi:hypothetical protein